MALTSVRVNYLGVWIPLSYNPAARRYEATVTALGTSIRQPGGYYVLKAEAVNSAGEVSSLSGEQYDGLRLTVRERTPPVLSLVSPRTEYVTIPRPTVRMDASDEPGGSGLDMDSFSVSLDGTAQTAGRSSVATASGIRLSWTPLEDLSPGPHTVIFSIRDGDGNLTAARSSFTCVYAAPGLTLYSPDSHRVVDDTEIFITGSAADPSGLPAVVDIPGGGIIPAGGLNPLADNSRRFVLDSGGYWIWMRSSHFSGQMPLEPGINLAAVKAVNAAGLASVVYCKAIRLITDRSEADAERMQELLQSGYELEQDDWMTFGVGQLLDRSGSFVLDAGGGLILMGGVS